MRRGFTLIEILIVVAIIAMLAAVAIPNVLRARTSANEATAIQNIRVLASSLETFRSANGLYPTNANWRPSMYGVNCNANTAPVPDFGPSSFCLLLRNNDPADRVQGYVYGYNVPISSPLAGTGQGYFLHARPSAILQTGTRLFFVDQTGIIRHCRCQFSGFCPPTNVSTARPIDQIPLVCN